VPLVTEICERVHDNGCKDVGRCDQTLAGSNIEAHPFVQNDGQEVGDGVGTGRGQAEEGSEGPDLEIESVLQVLAPFEAVWVISKLLWKLAQCESGSDTYSSGMTS
jgi:hypothetical protein